jgi:hypothetical protein
MKKSETGIGARNVKMLFFIGILIYGTASLHAQSFTPRNGTSYSFEVKQWLIDGADVWPDRKANYSHTTIVFSSDNTALCMDQTMGQAYLTVYQDGSFEYAVETIVSGRRALYTGTGEFKRNNKDFSMKASFENDSGKNATIEMTGRIK